MSRHAALSPTHALWSASTQREKRSASHTPLHALRHASTNSVADKKLDQIYELYATAYDEFEMAMEETGKVSIYAEADRKAAREELEGVKKAFRNIVEGKDAELTAEVKKRFEQKITVLEQGVTAMEHWAKSQD